MEHNFELSNADALDESISNAMGLDEQSNFCCGADGSKYSYNRYNNMFYSSNGTTTTGGGGATGGGATGGEGGGSKGVKIDPEKLKQGVQLAAGIFQGVQAKRSTGDADIDTICGKKPFCVEFFGNGCNNKKAKYQKCVDDAQRRKAEAPIKAQELELERQRIQAQMEQTRLEQQRLNTPVTPTVTEDENKGKKFLGMPKAVGITVAVVGGLALIVGGILIVRKMRK